MGSAGVLLRACAAGLIGAGAFWPVSLWPLILVSAALLLRLLRDEGAGTAARVGFAYGLGLAAGTMHWMFNIFGAFALVLLAIMAAYFALFAALFASTRGLAPLTRILLAAVFAVGVEWLRGDAWYLRFPWYTPPHALAAAAPMIAGARYLGVYGLSFLIWLIAAAGAFRPWIYAAFLALPAFWLLLPPEGEPTRRALLVQHEVGDPADLIANVPAQRVDLVVMPELAYARPAEEALALPVGPALLARRMSAPVVFGAAEGDLKGNRWNNVAAVAGPDGRLLGLFPKQRPVPLLNDGRPGAVRPVFAVDGGILGVAVCYDFDAPEVAGSLTATGATVLVAPTMDLMSWGRVQHEHHALLFRLRAVENARWLLRASSSGRTEAISPHGVPSVDGIEVGGPGHLILPFAHRTTWALGGRLAYLGPVAAAISALVAFVRLLMLARAALRETPTPPASPFNWPSESP